MVTVGTLEGIRFRKPVVFRRERSRADLAENLSLGTIVLVEVRLRGVTAGAGAGIIDVAFRASADRLDFLLVLPFEIRDVILVIPLFVEDDFGKLIDLKLLVLWGMGIIECPFPERNISADKI
jgi:hypothetical protein